MKKSVLMATLLLGFAGSVFAQSVTVDVPSGYKVVIVPSSVSVPQAAAILMPVLLVQLSMSAGTSILAEAGLTYLGVGVGAGVPSWGHSLATSVKFISIYPLTVLWPGLVVTMTVIALHLFGDALRDAIDPLTNPELREAA